MSIAQEVADDVALVGEVALGGEELASKLLDIVIAVVGHAKTGELLSAKAVARANAIADAVDAAKFGGGP